MGINLDEVLRYGAGVRRRLRIGIQYDGSTTRRPRKYSTGRGSRTQIRDARR